MADPNRIDSSDMESVDEDDQGKISMFRPDILAELRKRFCNLPDIDTFPESIKRRIKALKRLQYDSISHEAKFYEEVHALEAKYHAINSKVYETRRGIVLGEYEPNDEECDWKSDCEDNEELSKDLKEKAKIEDAEAEDNKTKIFDEDTKGIPYFWLTIFQNVGMLADMLQEHDEPILKHLQDIKIVFLNDEDMGFILEFYFEPNDYFTNSVLTKKYLMKCTPDKEEPFAFEGPEIYKSIGCKIDWKKGKNVTVKTITKNQKHKSRGAMRTITKTVQNDSFFNFFSPPIVPDAQEELDEDLQALLTSDYEIGHYFRERIVPRAVLYYTGEGLEDEDDDYEDEEDDEDEEEDLDEEEDEEENDQVPAVKGGKKNAQINSPDCRQQ